MQKCSIREGVAFVLFLVSMAAMDSDSRVLPVIILAGTLSVLYWMGQACGERKRKSLRQQAQSEKIKVSVVIIPRGKEKANGKYQNQQT